MLQHGSFIFPGTHGRINSPSMQLQARRAHMWGTRGTVQIVSELSMRQLSVEMWAFDSWTTVKAAQDWLESLNNQVGVTDTLRNEDDQGVLEQEFNECCFEAYEIVPLGGSLAAIRQDIAGTVESTAGRYFIPLRLVWAQLV